MEINVAPRVKRAVGDGGHFHLAEDACLERLVQQRTDPCIEGEEAYRISVTPQGIVTDAGTPAGSFYAMQTLRQMRQSYRGLLPCCEIEDEPVYPYRGVMIDCVRHFFPIGDLKKMLEVAALFKCNVFHWHLCDDQGWRLPVDRYPELTEKGAVRACSYFGRYDEPGPYGGSYTKEEIREIIAFCAQRHMDVMPEIEMPGHVSALLTAFPDLSCTGEPIEVKVRGGVHKDILCAGNENVYPVIGHILDEVVALFPYRRVHLGGDEAPKDHWRVCPKCQQRIREEGLRNEAELQGYFTNRIAAMLKERGRSAVVWNDALKGGNLSRDIMVQYWIGDPTQTMLHVNAGGAMINSDFFHYYLDYSYGQTPLNKVHDYTPTPEGLTRDGCARMYGVEAPIWTEYIPDLKQMAYMALPRLAAVAEGGWSRERGEASGFLDRLKPVLPLVCKLGLKPAPERLWNSVKPLRIWDALRFWYHAMTREDLRAFVQQMKEEKAEKEAMQREA